MRDNRNTIVIAILVLCIIIMMMTIVASASFELGVGARAAALYEPVSGTFIYEKCSSERLPMASTTKIMTALLTIEQCDLDEVVEIPKEAVGVEGSSVYLSEGDLVSIEDLLYSLLLQSANDAAAALALKISGDIASFAKLMNERAAQLGANDTHFDNPHGLDSQTHYTTARDLALIAAAALENPTFKKITSTYKHTFSISDKPRTVVNHNKLLRSYDGMIGVKTGYTRATGRCLVSAAERDGLTLISVTLDDPNDWKDHTSLLDYGFEHYEAMGIDEITKTEYQISVMDSETKSITATVDGAESVKLVREKNSADFVVKADIKPYVAAPVKIGDTMGEVTITKNGVEIYRAKIIATTEARVTNKAKFKIFDIFNSREK